MSGQGLPANGGTASLRHHSGDEADWTSGGIVLICCQVGSSQRADLLFRILQAYDSKHDALKGAKITLDSGQWSDCAVSALFALVGEVPENRRTDLLAKIHDAILVQRHFAIPFQ